LERARNKKKAIKKGQADNIKHVLKSESDLVLLMKLCEPMDTEMINELLKLAEYT
jgi:hypothetical protein